MFQIEKLVDFILITAKQDSKLITTVKLQQLLYYCQVANLVNRGELLFADDIEAWARGPIVRKVYDRFKDKAHSRAIDLTNIGSESPVLSPEVEKVIKRVVAEYIDLSDLFVELKIAKELPYARARHGRDVNERSSDIISYADIRAYYKD